MKPGPSGKVLALETEVQALSTYSEFPLEELRAMLRKKIE